jgi:hypothetical protein
MFRLEGVKAQGRRLRLLRCAMHCNLRNLRAHCSVRNSKYGDRKGGSGVHTTAGLNTAVGVLAITGRSVTTRDGI